MFLKNQNYLITRFVLVLALSWSMLAVMPAQAQSSVIRYVKWNAAGANNGSSWENAYIDLQSALAAASNGDEIWVAAGTYKPTSSTDRTISFTLKNGVAVYGGFAGTETERTQRDYETNLTILSGDIGVVGNIADNSYHVVVGSDMDSSAILDGFIVTEGFANGTSPYNMGGGMYLNNSGPRLMHMIFKNNHSTFGGGIANQDSSPVLLEVIFEQNSASNTGGGMYILGGNPTLTNVSFISRNNAPTGGGIANVNGNPVLENVTFHDGVAQNGAGMSNKSGAPALKNVTFNGNTVSGSGGAMYNEASNPTIINSIFWADIGGEITNIDGSVPVVTYSIVQGGFEGTGNLDSDPFFGKIADNGGFTQTMALGSESPAIDSGDDANCAAKDQRGVPRPQESHCDIGAYEYQTSVIYVKHDATGENNGVSWTDAYTDLQSALADASGGDEIWVAKGTYKPTSTTNRTLSFTLKDGLAVYGGFIGTETFRSQRDFDNNVTVLSGDIGVEGGNSDNSYHVVVTSNSSSSVLLDGFTITAGNADDTSWSQYYYGGGMYVNKGSPRVSHVVFRDNYAGFGGGMITIGEYANPIAPILTHVTFQNNSAIEGGGIRNQDFSSPILTNVIFDGNSVIRAGGGMENINYSSPTLTNVTFSNNTAGELGSGGGMFNWIGNNPTLNNVTFSRNTANWGGGIGNYQSHPSLTNVTFSGNSATTFGGGIANAQNSHPNLLQVTVSGNSAGTSGGGIYNDSSGSTATICNSILYNNAGGEIYNISSTANVTYSIVQGGYSGIGNINADPLLGPLQNNGGFTETMALSAGSLAINAADDASCPATDQRGVTRPQGSHCDIGAYEYDGLDSAVDVFIGDSEVASYVLSPQESQRRSFTGVNSGPVQIVNKNGVSILAAERVIYRVNGANTSFSEMVGLPDRQLDTTYWLPWYNNVELDTQLRIANVSNGAATVRVFIGGLEMTGSPFTLAAGASTRKSFPDVNRGPVKIVSDQNIVAAERVIYKVNGVNTSFSEMMALPDHQLDTTYWLPWYNNRDLDTQLRFANVTDQTATFHVYIAGQEMQGSPYTLAPGSSLRKSFPGVNAGPIQIVSDQDIVAAERVIYKIDGKNTSFSETMALPHSQLDTTYWLPWYNNKDLDTQLRFANTTNSTATVHVYIGGVEMQGSPFTLQPGKSTRKSFAGINDGPVQIVSDMPIVAAERVIYKVNSVNTSFSQMMALPDSQLDTTYWLPWYNNKDLDTQLRFGVP